MTVSSLSPLPPQRQAALTIPQDRPVYRIDSEKGFFGPDDCLYAYGSMIVWMDEPNPDMEPMNSLAHEAKVKYLEKLDSYARKVAEKTGNSYTSMSDAYKNSLELAKQDAKKIELVGSKQQVPLMGAKKRGPKKIEKVEFEQPAPLTGKGKLSIDSFGREEVNKSNGGI